jgi:shikimate dehydrogenase
MEAMNISGHTTPFAVLGHPIGHTLSPIMHNRSIAALGMDAIYLAFDAPPDRLMEILPAMRDMGFRGVNLTVPLKEVAFRGVDELDVSSELSGSVNTIEFLDDGRLRGHSTDGYGFVTALKESSGLSLPGQSVFVLGCGGAGRAVAITCADEGASRVVVSDIDAARADKVVEEIQALSDSITVESAGTDTADWATAAARADLVIQATPVGMKPEDAPLLTREAFHKGQMVFDLIYMYPETGIMTEALAAGAKAANGLGMLLHQGARSFEIWTGRTPAIAAMRAALEESVYVR